jgi:hypothetical protein
MTLNLINITHYNNQGILTEREGSEQLTSLRQPVLLLLLWINKTFVTFQAKGANLMMRLSVLSLPLSYLVVT